MRARASLAPLACLAFVGCQHPGALQLPEYQPYQPAPGQVLRLETALRVPADTGSLWISKGAVYPRGQFTFEPGCRLTLRERAGEPRVIEPAALLVGDTSFERGIFVMLDQPLVVAGGMSISIGGGGDRPSHVTQATHVDLQGGPFSRLTCARLGDWSEPDYLDRGEFASSLAGVITLPAP